MGRTRMARTDSRTDGQGGDYMLPPKFFGEHKNVKSDNAFLFKRTRMYMLV